MSKLTAASSTPSKRKKTAPGDTAVDVTGSVSKKRRVDETASTEAAKETTTSVCGIEESTIRSKKRAPDADLGSF